jgi:hypothetical protein
MSARDRQRRKVYAWEEQVVAPRDPTRIAIADAQGMVNAIWREVKGPARVSGEPLADRGMLMDGGGVDDGVHQHAGRNHRLDGVEETDELLRPMALHAATNYVAVQHV